MKHLLQKAKHFTRIAFTLLLGSCYGSSQTKTAMANHNHSGGFVVHTEQVDGNMNILAMLFGKVK